MYMCNKIKSYIVSMQVMHWFKTKMLILEKTIKQALNCIHGVIPISLPVLSMEPISYHTSKNGSRPS